MLTPSRAMLDDALRFLRVPPHAREAMLSLAERGFAELNECARPAKIWMRLPISVAGDEIAFGDKSLSCRSAELAKLFCDCKSCVIMAATLGQNVDRRIHLLEKTDMSRAVTLDACASVMVDSVCDELQREICEGLAEGEYPTRRFSPGYGDLPMTFSRDLLALLNAERRIGLTLSQKGMMIPLKSITALMGVASSPQREGPSCEVCNMTDCRYRKVPQSPEKKIPDGREA